MENKEKHTCTIYIRSQNFVCSKILELQEWLSPIKHITSYNYDGVSSAVLQLKQIADGIQKIPRQLITTCRILKHMTIQSDSEYPNGKMNC
jgi:hypothetical protein